jgi:hypothetical protein
VGVHQVVVRHENDVSCGGQIARQKVGAHLRYMTGV